MGDLPIALVTIGETRDISLAARCSRPHLLADTCLSTDLVIINEEAGSYERPLQERLEQLIQPHSLYARLIRRADLPEERGADSGDGSESPQGRSQRRAGGGTRTLPQQLGVPVEVLKCWKR